MNQPPALLVWIVVISFFGTLFLLSLPSLLRLALFIIDTLTPSNV